MSLGAPPQQPALLTTPAPPPMMTQSSPQGNKPKQKGQQASFLGAAMEANPSSGGTGGTGKTLLGQ